MKLSIAKKYLWLCYALSNPSLMNRMLAIVLEVAKVSLILTLMLSLIVTLYLQRELLRKKDRPGETVVVVNPGAPNQGQLQLGIPIY